MIPNASKMRMMMLMHKKHKRESTIYLEVTGLLLLRFLSFYFYLLILLFIPSSPPSLSGDTSGVNCFSLSLYVTLPSEKLRLELVEKNMIVKLI